MRFLKYLIAIPVIAYAAAMGYLWYEVKSKADNAVESASAFANIAYEGIHISPLGDEVGLDGITIKPLMTGDLFHVGELRLSVPHIGYFLNASSRVEQGKMPENLGMQLNRVQVDLNSELFAMMDQMQQQQAAMGQQQPDIFLSSLEALGCGDIERFGLSDYLAMGIGEVVGDVSVGMRYDEPTRITRIDVKATADGLYRTEVTAELDTDLMAMGNGSETFSFNHATLTYHDNGYYGLRNSYCTERNGGDQATYIDNHMQLLSAEIGAAIPAETLDAYRGFMLKGGTIVADMKPEGSLPVTTMQYYKPEEVVQLLGLKLRINNTPVKLASFKWGEKGTLPSVTNAMATQPEPEAVTPQASPEATPPKPEPSRNELSEYTRIDPAQANNYLNRTVEVTLHDGKIRSGALEGVGDSRLYLVMQLQGGELSYPVEIREIRQLRVKR